MKNKEKSVVKKDKTKTRKKKKINNKNSKIKNSIIKYEIIEKRNKILLICLLIISIITIIAAVVYKYLYVSPTLSIKDVYLENENKVVIKFKTNSSSLKDKVYCLYTTSENKPTIDDKNWVLTKDGICEYDLDENIYHTYLMNENNKIIRVYETDNIGTVKNLSINEPTYYLAVNDTLDLKITYDKYGYVDDNIKWTSSNESIATVENGKVKGLSKGNVKITASIMNKNISSNIVITDLITKRPSDGFDFNKKSLSCNKYSKSDNDLLDKILEFKINKVEYKTRASVVEAARFLTLDFPYRINYFNENGRLTENKIDGEGRYYHKGLYLDESRFDDIKKSRKEPKTWGCSLYSAPIGKTISNGLDCSGFVTWALLNAGFNPGDIGAGITKVKDLTDLGEIKKLTQKIATGNKIKVGDLLHNTWSSGHIAIIVGIDKNYYYVAQALWFDERGVIISKYKKAELSKEFKEVILMDKYYKKDGKLTNMW